MPHLMALDGVSYSWNGEKRKGLKRLYALMIKVTMLNDAGHFSFNFLTLLLQYNFENK
jgi:hypothetical protein